METMFSSTPSPGRSRHQVRLTQITVLAVRAPDPLGAGTVVQIDNAEPRGVRLPIRLVSVRNAQVHCVDSPVIGQGDDLGRFDEAEVFASSKELRPVSA